jgi:NAD(P)-dependent dehydrogenase (short-subunit alcohol dehydrogenase family)
MNIVITGSGSGIGQFLAENLAGEGHVVFGLTHGMCNIENYPEMERQAAGIGQKTDRIDGIINCAAVVQPIGDSFKVDINEWSKTVDVNLKGAFFALRAFEGLLRKSRRAKVMLFSGGGSTASRPYFSSYAVAKTGVVRLAEIIADECRWMDVNAIAPGATKTNMTQVVIDLGPAVAGRKEYDDALTHTTKGLPKVLALVQFLLSEKSDGLSGRLIAAQWDDWANLPAVLGKDQFRLRRLTT